MAQGKIAQPLILRKLFTLLNELVILAKEITLLNSLPFSSMSLDVSSAFCIVSIDKHFEAGILISAPLRDEFLDDRLLVEILLKLFSLRVKGVSVSNLKLELDFDIALDVDEDLDFFLHIAPHRKQRLSGAGFVVMCQ